MNSAFLILSGKVVLNAATLPSTSSQNDHLDLPSRERRQTRSLGRESSLIALPDINFKLRVCQRNANMLRPLLLATVSSRLAGSCCRWLLISSFPACLRWALCPQKFQQDTRDTHADNTAQSSCSALKCIDLRD